MKIHIRKIHSEGMECDETHPAVWSGIKENDNVRIISPVALKARITRAGDVMLAMVHVASRYDTLCYRCLEDIKRDWTADFTLHFDIEKNMEFIVIDEDIRQEIILNLPTRILCEENCKGLCIDCGINLNKQECVHKHAIINA